MKKTKRPQETKLAAKAKTEIAWWPWAVGLAAAIVAFQVYAPALNAGFVFDDRTLPFFAPDITPAITRFVTGLRPLLMFSFWVDYRMAFEPGQALSPAAFHTTNVILHAITSALAALIVGKLLAWTGVAGRMRAGLAIFAGGLFLLHPLQTESVAYVASRSEVLSVMFYYAAFAVFLYRQTESITLWRSLAVLALFAAAVGVKEHTLTLPVLFLLTDYYWGRGGLRKNRILYGLLAAGAVAGAVFVARVLRGADTAGFKIREMGPLEFFYTQCRVLWTYIRLFFLPYGQNVDPDVAVSHNLIEHGAIFGLLALTALVAAAWIYRKRFPLASYGVLVFLLLIAPTASIIPIKDPLAEHRMYLPMIGLVLVCVEFLRRLQFSQAAGVGAAVLVVCSVLTYKRNEVWSSSLTLWRDSVAKAPAKYRPRFQLAFAEFEQHRCGEAAQNYEIASHLAPAGDDLLIDWGEALMCNGQWNEAILKFRQAAMIRETGHVHTQVAVAFANLKEFDDALAELAIGEKVDPGYDMTYVYRAQVYEAQGNREAAAREYRRAIEVNSNNQYARDGLAHLAHTAR